jgi:hypothetical protein
MFYGVGYKEAFNLVYLQHSIFRALEAQRIAVQKGQLYCHIDAKWGCEASM